MCQPFPTPAGGDQRREARAKPVGARRGMDRLARKQLVVGGGDRVRRRQAQLELRRAPYSAWSWPISRPLALRSRSSWRGELIDGEEGVRAVGGPVMGGLDVVRVATDEELNLVSGSNLKPHIGSTPHL